MNPLLKLLSSDDTKIVELGILIEQINKALEQKSITQTECEELLAETSKMQKLLDDSITLDLRVTLNRALGDLYNTALAVKNLLPL